MKEERRNCIMYICHEQYHEHLLLFKENVIGTTQNI